MRRMRHLKPREIQGCQLALDASIPTSLYDATSGGSLVAADGTVARWEDQSGNARHVTQSTGTDQPLRRVGGINGTDSIDFDGSNDGFQAVNLSIHKNATQGQHYAVILRDDTTSTSRVFTHVSVGTSGGGRAIVATGVADATKVYGSGRRLDADASATVTSSSNVSTTPTVVNVTFDWGDSALYLRANNVTIGSSTAWLTDGSTSNTDAQKIGIGALTDASNNSVNPFPGHLGLVAMYDGAHTDSVRSRMNHALMRKWRING